MSSGQSITSRSPSGSTNVTLAAITCSATTTALVDPAALPSSYINMPSAYAMTGRHAKSCMWHKCLLFRPGTLQLHVGSVWAS
jgi:hypothetical protein